MKTLIIGKNSRLVNQLGINKKNNIIKLISHSDIQNELNSGVVYKNIFLFSFSYKMQENMSMIEKIKLFSVESEVYIISSTSVFAYRISPFYKYPGIKSKMDSYAISNGFHILRIGYVVDDERSLNSGEYLITHPNDICDFIDSPLKASKSRAVDLFKYVNLPMNIFYKIFYSVYLFALFHLGRYAFVLRPVDLILKVAGVKWYGYNALGVIYWKKKLQ